MVFISLGVSVRKFCVFFGFFFRKFCWRNTNVFAYRVQSQTPLRALHNASKKKKFRILKHIWPQKFQIRVCVLLQIIF